MGIIFNEVKKIFNVKRVVLLLVINIILYFLFVEFYIKYFPNGHANNIIYNMVVEMKQKYGSVMDENEFQDFKKKYNNQVKIINKDIENNEECKKNNVKSIDEFYNPKNENLEFNLSDKNVTLNNKVVVEKNIDTFIEIDAKRLMIYDYNSRYKSLLDKIQNKKGLRYRNRIKEIFKNGEDKSILYERIWYNYTNLIYNTSVVTIISVIFMMSTMYIEDRRKKIQYLQYTSKVGRKIFKYKAIAALICTFIITTIQLIIMFKLYIKNNIEIFFDSNINSFLNSGVSWYNIKFYQYIIITVIIVYILAFVFAVISLLISNTANKYITLIGIQLLIIIINIKMFLWYLVTCVGDMIFSKYFLPSCYVGIVIVSSILFFMAWRREKVLDIA